MSEKNAKSSTESPPPFPHSSTPKNVDGSEEPVYIISSSPEESSQMMVLDINKEKQIDKVDSKEHASSEENISNTLPSILPSGVLFDSMDVSATPASSSDDAVLLVETHTPIGVDAAQDLLVSLKTFIDNVKDEEEYEQRQAWLEESFALLQEQSWDLAKNEVSEILYRWGSFLLSIGRKKAGILRFWKLYEKFPGTKWYQQVFEELVAMEKTEDMVFVPATSFTLSETGAEFQLKPYFMDKYPVTNAKYYEFVKDTGYPAPNNWLGDMYPVGKANHPVVWVSAEDALAYAGWSQKRLPTEMEWENVAKGPEGFLWPWGNTYESNHCNCKETGIGDTTSIGLYSLGESPYHCYDCAGNVWEWTSSWYMGKNHRILRGGSWFTMEQFTTAGYRYFDYPGNRQGIYGFRCAKSFGQSVLQANED